MKKTLMGILILVFAASSLFVVGCGDDNGGGGGGTTNPPGPGDVDDFDFFMAITELTARDRTDWWSIMVIPLSPDNPIVTLELSIDGQSVPIEFYYDIWSAEYTGFTRGQSYTITAVVNGTTFTEDITIVYWPFTNLPMAWNMSEPFDLEWTLDGDNMWQMVSASASWWDPDTDDYQSVEQELELSPSDRSATIPANWLDIPADVSADVILGLAETNWAFNNRFAVISTAYDFNYYWATRDLDRNEITRRHIDRMLDLISR
ncbi:MAG: hypothetical protein K8R90_07180 [Candidatus Cloacimonetes bacterium]|nr:hypothetical protein [Candidatus Cloacimonadota bacterium]